MIEARIFNRRVVGMLFRNTLASCLAFGVGLVASLAIEAIGVQANKRSRAAMIGWTAVNDPAVRAYRELVPCLGS